MRTILVIAFLLFSFAGIAQSIEKKLVLKEGNEAYKAGEFDAADKTYEKAKVDGNYFKADYNQANALYKQQKYEEATSRYEQLLDQAKTDEEKSSAAHNMGNSYLSQKKYKEAVTAYKKSLKYDPADEETRYNLAYALQKLKDQQQQQQQNQ
ncbi:MAG TPA: hypothetical protein DCF89_05190, partial [Flavobacteriales bacterium]|nr:hypothetical protein [Flavobacteriales bacterium]